VTQMVDGKTSITCREGEILLKEDRDGVIQPFAWPIIWLAGIGLVSFIGYLFYDKYLTDRAKRI